MFIPPIIQRPNSKPPRTFYLSINFLYFFFHPPTQSISPPVPPITRSSSPFPSATIFCSFPIVRDGLLCLGWGRRGKVELGGEGVEGSKWRGRGGEGRDGRGGVGGEGCEID